MYGYTIGLSSDFGLITDNVKNNEFTVWSHAFEGVDLDADETLNSYKLAEKAMTDAENKTNLYIACGTEDFLYQENCRFHEYLNEIGYDHVFSTREGNHNWDFWDSEIKKVLDWLPLTPIEQELGF